VNEAMQQCALMSDCSGVYDGGCDGAGSFYLCKTDAGKFSRSGKSCVHSKVWTKAMQTKCNHLTSTKAAFTKLDAAKAACATYRWCNGVYEAAPEDGQGYFLCKPSATYGDDGFVDADDSSVAVYKKVWTQNELQVCSSHYSQRFTSLSEAQYSCAMHSACSGITNLNCEANYFYMCQAGGNTIASQNHCVHLPTHTTPTCSCTNGAAATKTCSENGKEECASCHPNFRFDNGRCHLKVCTCPHGISTTFTQADGDNGGASTACTTHGLLSCKSCDAGYRLVGSSCVAMNACTHNPCLNGGSCVDSPLNTGFDRRLTQAGNCPLTTNVQTMKVQDGNLGSCSCPDGYRKLELGATFSDTRRRRRRRKGIDLTSRRRDSGDKQINIPGEKDGTWVDWDKWINPKACTSTDHSDGTCAKVCVPTNDGQVTDPVCSYDLTNPSTGRCRCPGKAGKVSFGPTRADTRRRRKPVAGVNTDGRRRRNSGMAKSCNANDNECTWYDWTDQNQGCSELDIISGVCRSYCRSHVADIDHYTCKCKSGFTGANCEVTTSADACTAQAQAQFGTTPGGRAVAQGSWDHVPAGCSIKSSQSGIDDLWPGDPMSVLTKKRGTHGVAMRKCKLAKGSVDGPLSGNEQTWCMDRDYAFVNNGKLSSHATTKRTVGQPHFNTNKNPQNVDLDGFTPVYSDDHAVRARGGADVKEGVAFQPEIAIHGAWRPICAHWFDANNNGATQVCRQLGFGSGTVTRSGTLYKDAVFVGKCERGEGLGRCTGGPNNAKAWGHDSCTAGKAANAWVTCEPKKHCVFLHGAGACPMKFVNGKAAPLEHNVHPYTHDMSPGGFVESVTDGDFNGNGVTVTEGNVVAGPRFTNPASSAVNRYWGDVHLYTPQCKTRTWIWENTLTRGWNEHSLQQSYCNAAASKGAPRDLSLLKYPDGSLFKLNDQPVAADRAAPLNRNALTLASAIANVAGVKQGLLHMVAQKFGVPSITTQQIAAQLPAADQDQNGDLSDLELGGAAAQMGMEDPVVAAAFQQHFNIVLLPAQPVIEDTIVFTHSMGNNILSSALSKGVCKFGSRSSWYSVAGPMKGSAGSLTVDQMCHSEKLRKWVKILAPAGSVDAMCIMTAREKCYSNMMEPLTPTGTKNWHYNPNCQAPGAEANNNHYHEGRQTWRSLMPGYSPTEESAARNAMQAEPALKATVCGSQGLGQGVGQSLGLKRLGCFFTRNRNPAKFEDDFMCRAPGGFPTYGYDWSSNGENDGAVTVDSCKAAARPGWSTHTGLTHNKAEMWVTPQNHEDLTCRNGDYKRACTWYGLAQ
jgi:hypothetical protein